MSDLTVTLTCGVCGRSFQVSLASYDAIGMKQLPRHCPACLDEKQSRPQIVLDRKEIWSGNVVLGASAAEVLQTAQPFQPRANDKPCWRLIIKGSRFGASWSGRIDVYLHIEPTMLQAGQTINFSHLEAVHRVWSKAWSKQTLKYGMVSGYRRVPPETEGAEVKEEATQYAAIIPTAGVEPVGTLVWATAHTKTTIKGYGRQYWARLEGTPLWGTSVHGGARSGRYHTHGMLAVVEEGNPLVHVFKEGGQETRTLISK